MEPQLILVHSIMLLYWESKLENNTGSSTASSIKSIIDSVKLPENTMEIDDDREIIISLRSTALELCSSHTIDKDILIQRLKLATKKDDKLYHLIVDSMSHEKENDQIFIKNKCLEYSKLINKIKETNDFIAKMKSFALDYIYGSTETINVREAAGKIITSLESYVDTDKKDGHFSIPGVINLVDFMDESSVRDLFEEAIEESGAEGIIKTGFQAINRMTGWHNGLKRGNMVVVGALQHNFKTGFVLSLARHAAIYNTPWMLESRKQPLIYIMSSENSTTDNLLLLYQMIKENETGLPCDTINIDRAEATRYIVDKLAVNGYKVIMSRVDPSVYNYRSFVNQMMMFEAEGYEVHMVVMDYLNMLNKDGMIKTFPGSDTRDLFRRCRNFCEPRKILFVTPHQISKEAMYLLRDGVDDFVKAIANKSYWDSCKTLDQEVDLELYIHIAKVDGASYLTVQRGKHRKPNPITKENDLYTVLPFHDVGAIRDDINSEDLSLKKPGGGRTSEGGAPAWFDV